jgi:hypothetical protein
VRAPGMPGGRVSLLLPCDLATSMTRESYAELKEHIRTAPIVKVEKFKPAKDAR